LLADPLLGERVLRTLRAVAWPALRPAGWLYRRTRLRPMRAIAVTGSFGKTTTVRAISAALGLPDPGFANHKSRLALKLFRTPRRQGREVFEVGIDRPGQMRPMARMLRPDVAVLTGIGSEHNRSMRTLEVTLAEKSQLIRALPAGGAALLNADDARARSAASIAPGAVWTYGFAADADVRAVEFALDSVEGNRLSVEVRGRRLELQTRLLGRHQAYPILAGLAVAAVENVDLEAAAQRLESLPPAPGRMELIRLASGATLINDAFKGSPESYLEAFETIAALPAERRLLILGDISEPPGKQSEAYGVLGEGLARVPNAVVVHIGQDGKKFRSAARRAGMQVDPALSLGSAPLPALERIRPMIRPTDLILVKGRDTQKLDRIVAGLRGETVRCAIRLCSRRSSECLKCPRVAIG